MHSKLLLVDDIVGITGGRNYQNDYYDWDPVYNFRDRDVLVAGPATRAMADNFEAFWNARRTRRIAELVDVGKRLLREGVPPLPHPDFDLPERAQRMAVRSEEHTSELQSLMRISYAVFCLKKNTT